MPPTSFEVMKGVADPTRPSGSTQYDTILVKIPEELQAQSEILVFLTDQPMKGEWGTWTTGECYPINGGQRSMGHW